MLVTERDDAPRAEDEPDLPPLASMTLRPRGAATDSGRAHQLMMLPQSSRTEGLVQRAPFALDPS